MQNSIYKIDIYLNKVDGIYETGETIKFFPDVLVGSQPLSKGNIKWVLYKNLYTEVDKGVYKLGEVDTAINVLSTEPCFYHCKVSFTPEDGDEVTAMIGVGILPEEIKHTWEIPDDFDDFWNKQKSRLVAVPMKSEVTLIQSRNIKVFDVKVDCVDNIPVSGIMTVPLDAKKKQCPAVIVPHCAGFGGAHYTLCQNYSEKGFLAFDVNAHGMDNLQSPEYYSNIGKNELANYPVRGFYEETPDNIYFVNMFLRIKRAIEFIAERAEWDGKNLFLIGGSQGALQCFAGVYLDKRVTAIATGIPAGSNIPEGGWPLSREIEKEVNMSSKERKAMVRNAPYVDNVSFASKLNIPVYMTAGFVDEACRPDGVYAVYNACKGPKKIFTDPRMSHDHNDCIWKKCIKQVMTNLK